MDQVLEGLRKKPKPEKQQEQEVKFKSTVKEGELREIDDETLNEMLEGKTVEEIDAEKEKEEIIIEDARAENIDTDFNDFLSTIPNKVTNVKQGVTKRKLTEMQEKPKEKAFPKEKTVKKSDTKVIVPKRERISERKDLAKASRHEVFSVSLDEEIEEKIPKKENLVLLKKPSYYLNNREVFVRFIDKLFKEYRQDILEDKSQLSCDTNEQSEEFKLLTHQKIVREYINLYSPYRGLLIYHGLGSGKTCSSIAIAETFQQLHSVALAEGTVNVRKVVVMTPASLRTNFFEELKKCGNPIYRKNQYWEFVQSNGNEELEKQMSYALTLPLPYIKKNNGAWFVNVTKPSNFEELSSENKISLDKQLDNMIHQKYTFINYNGLRKNRLAEYTQNDTVNPFDNKVIIIDEAHNFVSRIVNKIEGDKVDEPKELSVKLYKLLLTAENARVVMLTGTPMINYPNEIGILFNILRGYIKSWEIPIINEQGNIRLYERKLKTLFKKHQILDTIEIQNNSIIYTRNPYHFTNKYSGDTYKGVENSTGYEMTDAELSEQILKLLSDENIKVDAKKMKVHQSKALPDDLENFQKLFIEEVNGEVKNTDLLKRRILGLTSYFRSAQEGLMPSYDEREDLHIENIEMSDYQYEKYEEARLQERKLESKKRVPKNKNDIYKDTTSTYRIFSRAFCNFVFPNPPGRPMPKEDETLMTAIENIKDEDLLDVSHIEDNVDGRFDEDEIAEAVEETKSSSYESRIKNALEFLKLNEENVLSISGLQTYSPKMLRILENIEDDTFIGSHLIYSQFRTLEGIGIFKLILEANGYYELRVKKNESLEYVLDVPQEKLIKGKMFSLYTGTETTEEKEVIRNIFNGNTKALSSKLQEQLLELNDNNLRGEWVKIFMITASGAEGISLKNVRYVHIMEPYWHPVRANQVIGRARRICSHSELPEEEQNIKVFMYLMKFSQQQIENMSNEIKNNDTSRYDKNNKDPISSDQALYEIMNVKDGISKQLLKSIKEAAMDCAVHNKSGSGEVLECYSFGNELDPKYYSYRPNIENEDRDANLKALNKKQDKFKAKKRKVNGISYALRYDDDGNPTDMLYDLDSFLQAKENPNITARLVGRLVEEDGKLFVDHNI
tara:strand:- start:2182 stop:5559 length:3378 start_codon:yes stop_codon:yes gene_type:complete